MSGPKADRLKLYRATGFNLSPVFGLYPDAEGEVVRACSSRSRARRRRWSRPTTSASPTGSGSSPTRTAISAVIGLMGPKPVFIADGHHRYETGLKYLEERQAAGEVPDDEAAAELLPDDARRHERPRPPHPADAPARQRAAGRSRRSSCRTALAEHFDIVERFGTDAKACWEHIEMDGSQAVLGFGTVADGQWFAAKLRDPAAMAELAPDQQRRLAGARREHPAQARAREAAAGEARRHAGVPVRPPVKEVTDAVAAKECQLAVLVPPATMEHVEEIAGNREKMPPKSTYFYPKLLTGLVFNSLKKD